MKKKLVYGLLAVAMACTCLMGCGDKADTTGDNNVEIQSNDGTEDSETDADAKENALREELDKTTGEEEQNADDANLENSESGEGTQEVAPEDAANEAAEDAANEENAADDAANEADGAEDAANEENAADGAEAATE